jgi:molybdenum cofactor cytidylyltransferase
MKRVIGIVLAAGESRRMGRLKALLPFGEKTVIEQVLQPLLQAELAAVVVVLGYRAADIAAVIQQLPVQILHNPEYQHGMTTSVQVALRHITPVPDAYLLALVDQPQLSQEILQRLLATCECTSKGIIIPTYQGKRGHPIVIAARYRQDILALGTQQGLHVVTRAHPEDTLTMPVDTDDILRDMDYQTDYEAELQRWQQRQQ